MNLLPEKLRNMTPYAPSTGTYAVRLDANESPFDLPASAKEKFLQELFAAPLNRYPDAGAAALCAAFGARYGIEPGFIMAGNGSDELIGLLLSSFLAKGDTLLLASPDFSMYRFYAELSEINLASCSRGAEFGAGALEDALAQSGARAVIFSNPCNPTGSGISRAELLPLIQKREDVLFLVDEAYMDFWDQSLLHDAPALSNLIVLRTLSKAWGAAGLRLGFAVSSPGLISALNAARSPYNVGTPAQILGRILLEQGESRGAFLAEQARKLEGQLKLLLPQARVFPTHTNFVYLETQDAAQIYEYLKKQGIIIRLFGQNALRITASVDEELGALYAALEQMKEASK